MTYARYQVGKPQDATLKELQRVVDQVNRAIKDLYRSSLAVSGYESEPTIEVRNLGGDTINVGGAGGPVDRLTGEPNKSELVLSDDGDNQTLTGDSGDLTLKIHGGDLKVQNESGGNANIHGEHLIDPDVSDVTLSRAIGTIYQNTNDTMLDIHVSVKMA